MPTWGEILKEIQDSALRHNGVPQVDAIRRSYLRALSAHTGRNTILYATRWLQGTVSDPTLVSIVSEDVHGLMEVVHGLDSQLGLDIVLHSPGGSPDAAEAMVAYLRDKFNRIRVESPRLLRRLG